MDFHPNLLILWSIEKLAQQICFAGNEIWSEWIKRWKGDNLGGVWWSSNLEMVRRLVFTRFDPLPHLNPQRHGAMSSSCCCPPWKLSLICHSFALCCDFWVLWRHLNMVFTQSQDIHTWRFKKTNDILLKRSIFQLNWLNSTAQEITEQSVSICSTEQRQGQTVVQVAHLVLTPRNCSNWRNIWKKTEKTYCHTAIPSQKFSLWNYQLLLPFPARQRRRYGVVWAHWMWQKRPTAVDHTSRSSQCWKNPCQPKS